MAETGAMDYHCEDEILAVVPVTVSALTLRALSVSWYCVPANSPVKSHELMQ